MCVKQIKLLLNLNKVLKSKVQTPNQIQNSNYLNDLFKCFAV